MTFVHGPEQAAFLNEKPAKLRFFVGYVDEFAPGDGSDRVRRGSFTRGLQLRIRRHFLLIPPFRFGSSPSPLFARLVFPTLRF